MILHNNQQLIYNYRASVEFPNDMCFDFFAEGICEDAIRLVAPDKSFYLVFGFITVEKDAQTFTEEVYEEIECITTVEPVHAIETVSGLSGYATTYALGDEICEEFAIDLLGAAHALFYARFSRLKDKNYDDVTYEEAKAGLLASIKEL